MNEITQIRKLSFWIFLIPLVAINLCLFISINYSLFDNTFFEVDKIGRSNFTIPYLDGSLSISRASRTFPQFLIFKPAMFITSIMLYFYWVNNNSLLNSLNKSNTNYKFKLFGILSAIFLVIHAVLLGVKFDVQIYKLFRRVILLSFIIFEIVAQTLLVMELLKIRDQIINLINKKILYVKTILVSFLIIIGIASLPTLIMKGNTHFKHALEWNYFVGVITFYLLTCLFWKKIKKTT